MADEVLFGFEPFNSWPLFLNKTIICCLNAFRNIIVQAARRIDLQQLFNPEHVSHGRIDTRTVPVLW
jgi:hypothetical protein